MDQGWQQRVSKKSLVRTAEVVCKNTFGLFTCTHSWPWTGGRESYFEERRSVTNWIQHSVAAWTETESQQIRRNTLLMHGYCVSCLPTAALWLRLAGHPYIQVYVRLWYLYHLTGNLHRQQRRSWYIAFHPHFPVVYLDLQNMTLQSKIKETMEVKRQLLSD